MEEHLELGFTEAEIKEFETRMKYDWFHLNLYSIFQDISRRSIKTAWLLADLRRGSNSLNSDSVHLNYKNNVKKPNKD